MLKLGPCKITFTLEGGSAFVIEETVEGQDCTFNAKVATNEIKVHQLPGAQAGNHYFEEAPTLACAVKLTPEDLPKLSPVFKAGAVSGVGADVHGTEIKFGSITVHPLSAGASTDSDIIGKKAYCEITNAIDFSNQASARADLLFKFSGNPETGDADYGMPFTFGTLADI